MIELYDSLSRKKKGLPDQKKIRFFVCGPTVYDYAHIGHARTYIFFDFFVKYLRAQGYEVNYLQNITDIDDRIIRRAAEENKKPDALAKFFTEAYQEDMAALGVDAVSEYAPATKFVSQIVGQVERLINKGYAYKIDGDGWYFDISKFADYGKLSGRTALAAEDSVSRIDEAVGKKNKGDFCLWKFSKPGEPTWQAAIGEGRPGWHIEDTAITEYYFGPQYDIHGGGVDLKFPHHEAEIAQQESASGKKPFVQIWMHTGALLADGKKMSKSLGNFITIRDFLKEYDASVLRWIVLSYHYRSPIDYTNELAENAARQISQISAFAKKLELIAGDHTRSADAKKVPTITKEILSPLEDDFNTPKLLAALLGVVSAAQPTASKLSARDAETQLRQLRSVLDLFGIALLDPKIPSEIKKLAAEREQSRGNKQFEQSDRLRKEINGLGYEIEDTPQGPFLWPLPKKHN